MECSRSFLQPLLRRTARIGHPLAPSAAAASRRHQSTTARTKRALKVAPHSSFLLESSDVPQIIYNPPSSTVSVYHTPFKFLPPMDPRRRANIMQLFRSSAGDPASASASAVAEGNGDGTPAADAAANAAAAADAPPPPALKSYPRKYNVTREEVEEMRYLRAKDPALWTVLRLAERYSCAPYFVMMCCRAPAAHREHERARLEAIKARWGPIRSQAREDRRKRKEMLLRGEI
ncbi:mitochondrial ribosomal protein subunit L20-domain-containing protein [Durotheca rogersii]|uniref:mitochondrial ribosomal protein subunit L20-domain-containing protein n=1 Tax=Durotheca rogersii TaxID=419775 RepID=UPI00221E7C77|nr:mitochondrial ribosomal protein subunit L20-domain-containing protein [Durotheca rogersii]KAI5859703.1 mitochondrial ribosomal protein subunit L20-domain-containing protein [Durotheca rogersii]